MFPGSFAPLGNVGGGSGGAMMLGPPSPYHRIKVHMPNMLVSHEFDVDRYVTAGQVRDLMTSQLMISNPNLFSLWAVSELTQFLAVELDEDVYPLDFQDREEWVRMLKTFCEKKKKHKSPDWYRHLLVLRCKSTLPLAVAKSVDQMQTLDVFFNQAVYDLLKSRFIVPESRERDLTLASLIVQARAGEWNKKIHKLDWYMNDIRLFFSRAYLHKCDRLEDAGNALMKEHKKLKAMPRIEAMREFLTLAQQHPAYNGYFMEVIVREDTTAVYENDDVFTLALTGDCFVLIDRARKPALVVLYSNLLDWEFSELDLVLTFDESSLTGLPRSLTFYTKKGSLICKVISTALSPGRGLTGSAGGSSSGGLMPSSGGLMPSSGGLMPSGGFGLSGSGGLMPSTGLISSGGGGGIGGGGGGGGMLPSAGLMPVNMATGGGGGVGGGGSSGLGYGAGAPPPSAQGGSMMYSSPTDPSVTVGGGGGGGVGLGAAPLNYDSYNNNYNNSNNVNSFGNNPTVMMMGPDQSMSHNWGGGSSGYNGPLDPTSMSSGGVGGAYPSMDPSYGVNTVNTNYGGGYQGPGGGEWNNAASGMQGGWSGQQQQQPPPFA